MKTYFGASGGVWTSVLIFLFPGAMLALFCVGMEGNFSREKYFGVSGGGGTSVLLFPFLGATLGPGRQGCLFMEMVFTHWWCFVLALKAWVIWK